MCFLCFEVRSYLQAERVRAQADTRARLWQHGVDSHSPAALTAAMSLWTIHIVGNNAKTAIMAALVLFKVRSVNSMQHSILLLLLL